MKKIILIAICLITIAKGYAQQDAEYTHFMYNKLALNPGYAGSRDITSLTLLGRYQWAGFEGAPKTVSFNIHSPVFNNKVAMGLNLVYDQLGIERYSQAEVQYAYRLKLTEKMRLAIGISGEVKWMQMLWADAEGNQVGDPMTALGNKSKLLPNAGFGLYLHHNKFYAGISAKDLIPNSWDMKQNTTVNAKQSIHLFPMLGFALPLGKNVIFMPQVLGKYVPNSPFEADINMSFRLMDALTLGATFRTGDSFDALVGYQFKNGLRLGYGYDYTFTNLRKVESGSHEVMLGWDFGNVKSKLSGFDNPRYF